MPAQLRPPFPYVGGKFRVAAEVWRRLGDVDSYVEPFCGSAACLFARPEMHRRKHELINDKNGYVVNALRAIAEASDQTARYAWHPTIHADLTARHKWLIRWGREGALERLADDPEYYDARAAGWWIWGVSNWISISDFCQKAFSDSIPMTLHGNGVSLNARPPAKVPAVGKRGVSIDHRTPFVGPGRGTMGNRGHAPGGEPPADWGVDDAGRLWISDEQRWIPWFAAVKKRLAAVYILNQDWQDAVSSRSKLGDFDNATVGVFLDPPYRSERRADSLYAMDDATGQIADAVWQWALEMGERPNYRIAVCAMAGDYALPDGWTAYHWRSHGIGGARQEAGRREEVVLFSPHCPTETQMTMEDYLR